MLFRQPGAVTTQAPATARSFTATGLLNGTAYTFAVRALSTEGNSASVLSNTVTPATVPGAPPITSATPGSGSVTLVWKKPAENGRPILGYQLISGTKTLTVSATALKGTLTGLAKGRTVQVGVRARNAAGYGATSVKTVTTKR